MVYHEGMTPTQTLEARLQEACHTAVSELPGIDYSDLVDCVLGQVPEIGDAYYEDNKYEQFILYWLHQYGADISGACQSHEPDPEDNGPMGISVYCNGTCETRRHL